MSGLLDFLAGGGALKKAAQGPTPPASPSPSSQPLGIDMQVEAQKAAQRAGVSSSPSPSIPSIAPAPELRHFGTPTVKYPLP